MSHDLRRLALAAIALAARRRRARAGRARARRAPPRRRARCPRTSASSSPASPSAKAATSAAWPAPTRIARSSPPPSASASRTWRAYLSTQAVDGQPAVNARDRIGTGPWTNARGAVIARDVAQLHGDTVELAQLGNNLSKATAYTETGEIHPGFGDKPNQHDIITGSLPDGRAYADAADHTCRNYTSSASDASTQLGHFDRAGGGNTSWNSAHKSRGCSQDNLVSTGGAGYLYCFAAN